jgi:ABC-type histidine transport system ATPase subunit
MNDAATATATATAWTPDQPMVSIKDLHKSFGDLEVLVTIQDLAEEGMTCILVTHEMGFAREVANHIHFTDLGVIVEHGPPTTFFDDAKDPRTKEFLSQIL